MHNNYKYYNIAFILYYNKMYKSNSTFNDNIELCKLLSILKNLINSIKLISINYMFSTNNTMHKFGIEYSYIAIAMGTMLKSTDNSVKNMEINQTNAIAIDWNWFNLADVFGSGTAFEITLLAFLVFGGPVGLTILVLAITGAVIVGGLLNCIYG